jgi:epoxyqueuosine reductase
MDSGTRSGGHPARLFTRRDLLSGALATCAACGTAAAQGVPAQPQRGFGGLQGGRRRFPAQRVDPSQIPAYVYRTLPVSRFPAMQKEYERAVASSQLSRSKAFRDDIAGLGFSIPADFGNARSVVVAAVFARTMSATFRLDGRSYPISVPPQYYVDNLNGETLGRTILNDVIKDPARRVLDVTERIPLKLLAARSGLGRYGRNNLIFVDGMGSYNLLYAFLTDQAFPNDTWTELSVLDICRRCDHCDRICPTYCISRSNFVIDIDKCITLYNENAGAFPNWILPGMHHALVGCLRCQAPCRVNAGIAEITGNLGDVSEADTLKILQGPVDAALLRTLQTTLRLAPTVSSRDMVPVLARNLRALMRT